MSRLFSIEPVGILNACTTKVRMNRARMTAMTTDSKYSRTVDFLNVIVIQPFAFCLLPFTLLFGPHLEHSQERLLRNLHAADLLHPLFPFLLLFEQLSLSRDVSAVALRQHVLAHRFDRFTGDDAAADGRLNRDLEHLPRNQLPHLRRER